MGDITSFKMKCFPNNGYSLLSNPTNMDRVQDSVVQGNVAGRDVNENVTYITNTTESNRTECPSCGTSGMITIYECNSCRTKICDTCRVNGHYNCVSCWNAFANAENKKKEGESTVFAIIVTLFAVVVTALMIGIMSNM